MKNLKRIFSLALAGTMLAGMLTIGASAAEFTDDEKIVNQNAVDTMVALNIISGKPDGSFDPEATVTRAEMAKMITVALNGGKDPVLGTKTTPTFSDIKGHWAEKYIEYCANLGIINGRGNGTFDPAGTVTGSEAAKMVLVAMGYDSTVFKFTGADWALNVNIEANNATPYKLYEEIENVDPNAGLSRDNAAQLIFNGVQDHIMVKSPSLTITNGEISYNYTKADGAYAGGAKSILTEKYGAKVWIGTFEGNTATGATSTKGEIVVNGKLDTAVAGTLDVAVSLPSDLDISNIGEEVKVIFKDGKGGTNNVPDAKDNIYGVFNTGATTVYNIKKADLQNTTKTNKIKFGGVEYSTLASIDVVTDYNSNTAATVSAATIELNTGAGWRQQLSDSVKFVTDTDGKIAKAYVTTYALARVTALTSSKVTLSGVGAISIEDNEIYEDIAKDDVVLYTKFYSNVVGDALFTVTKPETVEGKVTGFKADTVAPFAHENIVVDGTAYNVDGAVATFPSTLTDKAITKFNNSPDGKIGDTVKLYMVNGLVGAVDKVDSDDSQYALFIEKNSGTVGSNMDPLRVTVMLANGEKVTRTVHKDSTKAANTALTAADLANAAYIASGNNAGILLEYSSLNETTIKIKALAPVATAITGTGSSGAAKLWDSDTKELTYTGTSKKVAASDAVLFVARDTAPSTPDGAITLNDSFNAYDLRSLGEINNTATGVKVSYFIDPTTGLVKAAYAILDAKPNSESADTLYGIVTKYVGTRTNDDDDTLYLYKVAVGQDEDLDVLVQNSASAIAVGDIITFDETSNKEYAPGDFTKVLTADDTPNSNYYLAAVRDYNSSTRLMTTYGDTTRANATSVFAGTAETYTLDKDVKVYYVNGADIKQGEEVGLGTSYNPNNGYANAILHKNAKGVVDVVILETSGNANLAKAGNNKKAATVGFGNKTGMNGVTLSTTSITAAAPKGGYTLSIGSVVNAEAGSVVTINVTCTTAPTSGVDTVIFSGVTAPAITFGTGDQGQTKTTTFTMPASAVTITASR